MLGGVSINGKSGRPDDTIGIGGVVNGISNDPHRIPQCRPPRHLDRGRALTNYRTETIIEAYYSYALTASTRTSFDYLYVTNPGYDADQSPPNIFTGRAHWQF